MVIVEDKVYQVGDEFILEMIYECECCSHQEIRHDTE